MFTQSPFSQPGSENRPVGGASLQPGGKSAVAQSPIPPPPPAGIEAKIRTMAEDIAQMGKSGIRPSVITVRAPSASARTAPGASHEGGANWKLIGLWVLVAVVGSGVLFGAGYYLLPLIFSGKVATQTPVSAPVGGEPSPQALPTSTTPAAVSFTHGSFLRSPADSSFTLDLQDNSASGGATYGQSLQSVLQNASTSVLAELKLSAANGQYPSWNQFLSFLNLQILTPDFWTSNFESDFTMLLWKDKNGAWPVYVLKLKSGGSPLLLQSSVLKLESSGGSLTGLFASPPGVAGAFQDAQLSGQPVRLSVYSTAGASLVYGWAYNQYLLLSTNQEAWQEALKRL